MSVLLENNHGWFICCETYADKILEKCFDEDDKKFKRLKFRSAFYHIKTPYVMKSSAIRISQNVQSDKHKKEQDQVLPKKRKQKKLLQNISPIESSIKERSQCLIKEAQDLGYLENSSITSAEWFENNIIAQKAAKEVPPFLAECSLPLLFSNAKECSVLKTIGSERYVIPAQSTFHLCDISNMNNLKGLKFDLIMMDPPWENKSVRRKKGYATLSCDSLIQLPIEELCWPGCLIIVWVTNNNKQINFVKDTLFPKWNVRYLAIWHWIKITQKGSFIHPIEWHHKKPYENLLLGRFINTKESDASIILEPESHKTIVSVPSSIHSQKPPLIELLKPYLPETPKCLELFARYLLPEWTSLGNEVLKLQNIKLFESPS